MVSDDDGLQKGGISLGACGVMHDRETLPDLSDSIRWSTMQLLFGRMNIEQQDELIRLAHDLLQTDTEPSPPPDSR